MLDRNQKDVIRNNLIKDTVKAIKDSTSEDIFIIQTINHIDELQKTINTHGIRFVEWLGYVIPELTTEINNYEVLAEKVATRSRSEILSELSLTEDESMGYITNDDDYEALKKTANLIRNLFLEKKRSMEYLDSIMGRLCPNINRLAGSAIGARLINHAGSLKKLTLVPASKIQLYGAEKALFRHLKTGAKSPKHGIIHEHPFVQKAADKGKAARIISDKIAICAKVDYFKGDFIADKIIAELEDRFGEW